MTFSRKFRRHNNIGNSLNEIELKLAAEATLAFNQLIQNGKIAADSEHTYLKENGRLFVEVWLPNETPQGLERVGVCRMDPRELISGAIPFSDKTDKV